MTYGQILAGAGTIGGAYMFAKFFAGKHFTPEGKHCYIGGASEGLGLALACLLAKRGVNVTIVSRSRQKLDVAVEEIRAFCGNNEAKIQSFACDLTDPKASAETYRRAIEAYGNQPPYAVFTCAGGCTPGLFVDVSAEEQWKSMELNFRSALNTIHEYVVDLEKDSRDQKRLDWLSRRSEKRHVVITASIVAMLSFPGYVTYSPSKYALRGLVEGLRSETAVYGAETHLYLPGTILSPGFEREQQLKPHVTKVIEGSDPAQTPMQVAEKLIKGLEKGQAMITADFMNDILRTGHGLTPGNGLLDYLLGALAMFILPIFRVFVVDKEMKKARLQQIKST